MAANREFQVKVTGVRQLATGFKRMETGLDAALKAEFLKVADDVVGEVQQTMPHKTGRAQRSVKASSTASAASIRAGGRAAPYYHWLDFGGTIGSRNAPGHTPGQGVIRREWMGKNVKTPAGRYLYPAISDAREETAEAALDAVEKVARKAGFEVKG